MPCLPSLLTLIAVCGQDGITYPNECEMGCFSVKLDHKGVCKKEGDTSTAPSPPNGIAVGERDPTCTCPLYFVYDPGGCATFISC
jgi:hypothetical protein